MWSDNQLNKDIKVSRKLNKKSNQALRDAQIERDDEGFTSYWSCLKKRQKQLFKENVCFCSLGMTVSHIQERFTLITPAHVADRVFFHHNTIVLKK